MQIRELDLKELYPIYDVISQLRTNLSYKEFEDLIYDMRHMDYKMIGIMEGEELVTYAGVAIQTNLSYKRHLHIFDLVTDEKYRAKGYGLMMLDYLKDYAKMGMCERVLFSSEFNKEQIHNFYEKNGFEKQGSIFTKTF